MTNSVSIDIVDFKKEMKRVEEEMAQLASLEIDKRIDYATNTLRVVTPVDTGKARSGWKNTKKYDEYGFTEGSIINDVDYIDVLNKGHSKQAPRYFIEQVLSKIGIITPE
jgi:hypothetical protein